MRAPALAGATRRGLAALVVLVVLALAGFAALRSVAPPAAEPASAPADRFSAGRAFEQVEAIATAPHPAGGAQQAVVRDHLVRTLTGLGLSPQVQDTTSVEGGTLSSSAGGVGLAHVANIVTVIPGTAATGRIFLVAHYDSAQTAPGANDDAAGTATVLETARALTAGPRLRNDVVLVLTDAEEACLCGAKAFVDQHPLAADGGIVINLEARGSSGPAIMFETTARNSRLVDVYGEAPRPVGTSFAVEIYRLLPNDTDFTAFRTATRARFTGLNAAYIDGAAVYHAPTDVPSAMDKDSLQHHGDNALAVTRALGDRDIASLTSTEDATYFPVPGGLARYPGAFVWPVALLAFAAVAALAFLARRRHLLGAGKTVAAALLTLVPIVAAPALAQLFWLLMTLIRPEYAELPVDPYRPLWFRLAVLALSAFTLLTWYAVSRRRLGPVALAVGGLGWLAALGLLLAALAPGGSYLAALPALAGAVAGIVAILTRGWWTVVAVTAGAIVAVVILLPTVVLLFPALGMPMAGAGAFIAVLLGLALLPVVDLIHPEAGGQRGLEALSARRRAVLPSLMAAVAVVACTLVGLWIDRFDPRHPALTHLMYAQDADDGTAQWLSDEPTTQEWTGRFVSGEPHQVDDELPAFGPKRMRTGSARNANLPAPGLSLVGDTRSGDARTMRLLLQPARPVRLVSLHVDAKVAVAEASVQGRPVPVGRTAGGDWGFGFVFHGPPAGGVEVTLTVRAAGPVRFRVMDGSDGLSGVPGFEPRPAAVGVVGSHSSEMLAVVKTYTL